VRYGLTTRLTSRSVSRSIRRAPPERPGSMRNESEGSLSWSKSRIVKGKALCLRLIPAS